jgi:hypothetical protein
MSWRSLLWYVFCFFKSGLFCIPVHCAVHTIRVVLATVMRRKLVLNAPFCLPTISNIVRLPSSCTLHTIRVRATHVRSYLLHCPPNACTSNTVCDEASIMSVLYWTALTPLHSAVCRLPLVQLCLLFAQFFVSFSFFSSVERERERNR